MEAKNLTQENVASLTRRLKKMTNDNPDLNYKFFEQEDGIEQDSSIQRLEQKIDALSAKLDLIFGDYVLIDGQWINKNNIK